jgi:hypothetical protein
VNRTDLLKYLKAIASKYGSEYEFLKDLDLEKAYKILRIPKPSCMKQKAEAQILALLLTSLYKGDDYTESDASISCVKYYVDYDGDMAGAIKYILKLYGNCYYWAAKDLADRFNNVH